MANPSVNQNDQGQTTLENIWRLITQLPDEMRSRLRARLDEDLRPESVLPADRLIPFITPPAEFAAEWEQNCKWLNEHGQEYAGRWVALDGDRLITAGSSAREVYAALKVAGISGSMVLRVEEDLSLVIGHVRPSGFVPKAIDPQAAVKLLESFYDEDESEQRETWALLERALVEHRP